MRRAHAVRCALVDLEGRILDQLGGQHGRGADRHDLVIVAMQDQGRDVELLQVLGQIRLGKGLDAKIGGVPRLSPQGGTLYGVNDLSL